MAALSREEAERIRRLLRRLDLHRRQEVEGGVAEIGRLYTRLLRELEPLLAEMEDADDLEELEESIRAVAGVARNGLADAAKDALEIIERLIEQSARRGAQAPVVAVLGAALPAASVPRLVRIAEAAEAANRPLGPLGMVRFSEPAAKVAAQVQRKVYADGLNLSQRLHRRTAVQQAEFTRTLAEGMQRGRAAVELAKDLQRIGGIAPEMPKYLDAVVQAARAGDQIAFEKALAKAQKIADSRKAGSLGVRDFTRQFLSRMRKAEAHQIEAYTQDYLRRKARYQATVVARHETNEANRAAYIQGAQGKPWVLGLKRNLSASHPHDSACECEELATQDLYGLGPGVYPVDRYPETPHPNCLCFPTQVMDAGYFDRDTLKQVREAVQQGGV
jgi:hypothetical protein